jgi:hypothetical protein
LACGRFGNRKEQFVGTEQFWKFERNGLAIVTEQFGYWIWEELVGTEWIDNWVRSERKEVGTEQFRNRIVC